jgi:hypothetical protein
MKLFLTHPRTKQEDPMLTLTCIVVIIAAIKFLFEGVDITIAGHVFSFGHADGGTYATVLTPVLGAHGYMNTRIPDAPVPDFSRVVDNPDGDT